MYPSWGQYLWDWEPLLLHFKLPLHLHILPYNILYTSLYTFLLRGNHPIKKLIHTPHQDSNRTSAIFLLTSNKTPPDITKEDWYIKFEYYSSNQQNWKFTSNKTPPDIIYEHWCIKFKYYPSNQQNWELRWSMFFMRDFENCRYSLRRSPSKIMMINTCSTPW